MSNKHDSVYDAIRGLNQALTLIELASETVGRGAGGREVSLAKTNAQQARHWLQDALTELNNEPADPMAEAFRKAAKEH